MTKFKPFTTFNTSMDYPTTAFLEEYVEEESINHFNGKPYHARKEFVGLALVGMGIDVYVLPYQERWSCCMEMVSRAKVRKAYRKRVQVLKLLKAVARRLYRYL